MDKKLNKFQQDHPRYDLYTKEILAYKGKDFYLLNCYSNKTNLSKHFKDIDNEERIEITKKIITNRVEQKNIKYIPCQVELKTLIAPAITSLEKVGINYSDVYKDLNLISKYKYGKIEPFFEKRVISSLIQDSREQKGLVFNKIKSIVGTLSFGDYSLSTDLENTLAIERKSLSDFVGTLSGKSYERFEREIIRAKEKNSNLLMVVEKSFSESFSFNYQYELRYSKATPEYIFSNLRKLIQKYPNFQVAFAKDREESAKLTEFALSVGKSLFDYDIEYLLNKKLINI